MSLVDGHTYLDTQLIRALAEAACEGPTAEQVAAAPESLVRYCHAGPRQVRDLYPWGQRRRYRPRMVRALIRDLVEREQLAASDPVGLADWSWVWHPDTATGPGTPKPIDLADLVATPEEAEAAEEIEGEDDEETPPAAEEAEEKRSDRVRSREVRGKTVHLRSLSRRRLAVLQAEAGEHPGGRPRTRGECPTERPCPWVSCRHHLYLDIQPRTGAIKLNFPDIEVEDMPESCSLDVADRGGATLEAAGAMMNLTRERVRQLEVMALGRFADVADLLGLEAADLIDPGRKSAEGLDGCAAAVLAALRRGECSRADLPERTGYSLDTVDFRLAELVNRGLIERVARGRYRAVRKVEAAE